MGRLYKRGATWWAYYRDPSGERRRQTLATSDKQVAAKRLRELELVGPTDRPADSKSLKDALSYLIDTVYAGRSEGTVNSYQQKARHLIRLLGGSRPVNSIERPHVHEYRATRIKEGAADGSVYKELVVLRLALKEQGIEGVVPKVPVNYQPRTRALTEAQAVNVVAGLAEKRRLWFVLACLLGLRDKELNGLDWSDVDVERRMVRVRGTKTKGSFRLVPIGEALVPWLEMFDDDERVGHVVETWTNRRRDITAAWWKVVGYEPPKKWTQGKKRCGASIAGAPRLSPNDLRRTFTSWLKQAGVDSLAVAHLLGHTSTRMVEAVYGRLNEQTYRDAISKLPGCGPRGDNEVRRRENAGDVLEQGAAGAEHGVLAVDGRMHGPGICGTRADAGSEALRTSTGVRGGQRGDTERARDRPPLQGAQLREPGAPGSGHSPGECPTCAAADRDRVRPRSRDGRGERHAAAGRGLPLPALSQPGVTPTSEMTGGCTPGVHDDTRSETQESTPETTAEGETSGVSVPRVGIEPTTRGFSGLEALVPRRVKAPRLVVISGGRKR